MTSSAVESTSKPDGSAGQDAADRRPRRLPSLTGMRFVCAVLVFGTNATVMGFFASPETGATFTEIVRQGGYAGITYFFILSGFILTWCARPGEGSGSFWRRRFFRIYPAYLLALAAGFVLTVAVQGMVFNKKWAILDVFMVQSWAPDIETRSNTVAPLWSLSVEAFFYLCFPLLLHFISKVRPERLWAWVVGVVAAIFAIPVVVSLLPTGTPYPDYFTNSTEVWLIHQFPATRLLEFVLGIFLARIVLTGRRLPVGLGAAVALSVVAYWLASYLPGRFHMVAIMVVPLALVVAAGAARDVAGRRTFISGRAWVWLGNISYSFFVLQWLVLLFGHLWITGMTPQGDAAAFGLIALLFVVTLGLAWVLHVTVERPLTRRFSRSRRSEADRPAPELTDDVQEAGRPTS